MIEEIKEISKIIVFISIAFGCLAFGTQQFTAVKSNVYITRLQQQLGQSKVAIKNQRVVLGTLIDELNGTQNKSVKRILNKYLKMESNK